MFDLFPFIIGFLGSFHCLGMCGPLVLAYSLHCNKSEAESSTCGVFSWRNGLLHHVAFHSGRLLMYAFLGAVASALFQAADLSALFSNIRSSMTIGGGILLIFLGLVLLHLIPLPQFVNDSFFASGSFIASKARPLLHSRSVASKIALGACTGALPCCLSWAMIITAATADSISKGIYTMLAFGLGTTPALFFTGVSASFLSARLRFLGDRAAAISVISLGFMLVLRGATDLV